MQPEIGSTWVYTVSSSCTAKNVLSFSGPTDKRTINTKPVLHHPVWAEKQERCHEYGKNPLQNATTVMLGCMKSFLAYHICSNFHFYIHSVSCACSYWLYH